MTNVAGSTIEPSNALCVHVLLVLVLSSLTACIGHGDPYWIFRDEHTVVWVQDSTVMPWGGYGQVFGSDTVNVRIMVRRAMDLELDPDTNSLMIDLIVGPKRLAGRIHFNPTAMAVKMNGVDLRLRESRDRGCGRFDCSYRASFWLDAEECLRVPTAATEPWCVIDLDGVLVLDSVPVNIGRRYGWLPYGAPPWNK